VWFQNQHLFVSCSSSVDVKVSLQEFRFIFHISMTDIFMGFAIAHVLRDYLGSDSGSQNPQRYGSAEKELWERQLMFAAICMCQLQIKLVSLSFYGEWQHCDEGKLMGNFPIKTHNLIRQLLISNLFRFTKQLSFRISLQVSFSTFLDELQESLILTHMFVLPCNMLLIHARCLQYS